MPASNLVKQNTLAAWMNNQAVTYPSALFVALYLTDPTGANTGTEVSGNGYARASVTMGAPSIQGNIAQVTNTAVAQFPQATGSWGTPLYFGVCDAASGGNLLFYDALPTTFAVTSGMAPKFNAGELRITAN